MRRECARQTNEAAEGWGSEAMDCRQNGDGTMDGWDRTSQGRRAGGVQGHQGGRGGRQGTSGDLEPSPGGWAQAGLAGKRAGGLEVPAGACLATKETRRRGAEARGSGVDLQALFFPPVAPLRQDVLFRVVADDQWWRATRSPTKPWALSTLPPSLPLLHGLLSAFGRAFSSSSTRPVGDEDDLSAGGDPAHGCQPSAVGSSRSTAGGLFTHY